MAKQPIDIKALGGINANHNRPPGQFSDGMNFITRAGGLRTRSGTLPQTVPAGSGPIISLHCAGQVGLNSRLFLEEAHNLWVRQSYGGAWQQLASNLTSTHPFKSAKWQSFLLLVNGVPSEAMAFDLINSSWTSIQQIPMVSNIVTWKFRPFAWSPNSSTPNRLWFCGYDGTGAISRNVWPADFFLDIGGEGSSPILNVLPFKTHLLCLTNNDYKKVYGSTEKDFEIVPGEEIGCYGENLSGVVLGNAIWVGADKRVYIYSGSNAVSISEPIDEFIEKENIFYSEVFCFGSQFWWIFQDALNGESRVFVYDLTEKQWFKFVFPYVITGITKYGEYMDEEVINMGTDGAMLYEMKAGFTSDGPNQIITEMITGPLTFASRRVKSRKLKINAQPRNNFTINIYATVDDKVEQGPFPVSFVTGPQVYKEAKIKRTKGTNTSYRITSTDRISEIQELTPIVIVGRVK